MQSNQHGVHPPYHNGHLVVTTNNLRVKKFKQGMQINQYILGSKIGSGKNGTVYAATSEDNESITVAVKAIKRETKEGKERRKYNQLRRNNLPRETNHMSVSDAIHSEEHRVRREIAIMKKLHHPHIVQLFEVLDDRIFQTIYLVMEYCGGGEVEWKDQDGSPTATLEQTRRIMRDAISGLDYLHNQGIIHRDIKPANLLWTTDRVHVKIADFGTAHYTYAQKLATFDSGTPADEDPTNPFLLDDTNLAIKAGTPMFMAPEVVYDSIIRDEQDHSPPQPITKAIDVWALGVTFFCLLFGRLPFRTDPDLSGIPAEYQTYRLIDKESWTIDDYMSYHRIPTHDENENSEASLVIHLLQHFLTKNVTERITLAEVKTNPWFLNDLPDKVRWLQDNGGGQILVSQQEASVAMTATDVTFFRPYLKRVANGLTTVLGLGFKRRDRGGTERVRGRGADAEAGPSKLGRHRTVTDIVRRPKEHIKGKTKDAERSLSRIRATAATLSRQSSIKSRKDISESNTPPSSGHGFSRFLRGRSSRIVTPKTPSPEDSDAAAPPIPKSVISNSRIIGSARASAEVLRYHHPRAQDSYPGSLTRDRRISSWGDHPTELRNTMFDDSDDVAGDGHLQFWRPSSEDSDRDDIGKPARPHHMRVALYDSESLPASPKNKGKGKEKQHIPASMPGPLRIVDSEEDLDIEEEEDYGVVMRKSQSKLHAGATPTRIRSLAQVHRDSSHYGDDEGGDVDDPSDGSDFDDDDESGIHIAFGRRA